MKIVFGVDPDSAKHGVAIYTNGRLEDLLSLSLFEIYDRVNELKDHDILFSIEDVCANNFVYARNVQQTKGAMAKVGMGIGKCQQSQVELMRMLDYLGIRHIQYPPTKSNWAKNKAMFQKLTGWNGRSNEDTRSAAYFGFLGL